MINILKAFSEIKDYYSPKVVGEINDVYIKIAKGKGEEIPWHSHENEDELFYIVEGSLLMEVEGKDSFTMSTGDIYVVKKGIKHRISSAEECKFMLIESKTTKHTGEVSSDITKSIEDQLS